MGFRILDEFGRTQTPDTPQPVKPWWNYDEESGDTFHWADEWDPQVAAELQEFESHEPQTYTGSQTVETYHRLFETNEAARRQFKFAQQDEWKLQRTGRILHMNDFMHMLRQTKPRRVWRYTDKGGWPGMLGLFCSRDGERELEYVGFVQVPFMQEYEEMYFDRYDVPCGIKRRGWRTILMKIVQKGFLPESAVHDVFGLPASNAVSRRYREFMQFLRTSPRLP